MAVRNAKALWTGTLKEGKGEMNFSNFSGPYTFSSRFEDGDGTNPEELIGAAYAGCYSMFLSALISDEGLDTQRIETNAEVNLENDDIGPNISLITLTCNVDCEGLTNEKCSELAQEAKEKCPISRLYAGGTAKLELIVHLRSS